MQGTFGPRRDLPSGGCDSQKVDTSVFGKGTHRCGHLVDQDAQVDGFTLGRTCGQLEPARRIRIGRVGT